MMPKTNGFLAGIVFIEWRTMQGEMLSDTTSLEKKKSSCQVTIWSGCSWAPFNLSSSLLSFLFSSPPWSHHLSWAQIYKHRNVSAKTVGRATFWTSEKKYLRVIFREALMTDQLIDSERYQQSIHSSQTLLEATVWYNIDSMFL